MLEGVMMKSKKDVAIAVRRPDGGISVRTQKFNSVREKHKLFRIPVIRGIVNFIETLIFSFSTMTQSAEMLGIEEGEPGKFEKWLQKHFGKSIVAFASILGVVLGLGLAVLLFIWLPWIAAELTERFLFDLGVCYALFEGVIKIGVFLLYLFLVSLIPDIKRTFMYHGAEHKSIFCYESGEELNVDNVRKQKRFHPRCGTSFMFIIILLSIIIGTLIPTGIGWIRIPVKMFLSLPLVVGLGFEYIMYAGKHDNRVTRFFSAPGLWIQRITTKEPDDKMIEVAITSVKSCLRAEFPDFEIPVEPASQTEATETEEKSSEEVQVADNENN